MGRGVSKGSGGGGNTAQRLRNGSLLYDPKTGGYIPYNGDKQVIYDENLGRSYRINSIQSRSLGGAAKEAADADFYYNGKWMPVRSEAIREELAKKAKRKR